MQSIIYKLRYLRSKTNLFLLVIFIKIFIEICNYNFTLKFALDGAKDKERIK